MPPKGSKKAAVKKAPVKKAPVKKAAAKKEPDAKKPDSPKKGKKHVLDDDDDDDVDDTAKPPAKKLKSGPIAQLRTRATQLGIELEGTETLPQIRELLDTWLDDLEEALRSLELEKHNWPSLGNGRIGVIDISLREETEPRWEKRQAAKEKIAKGEDAEEYSDLDDVDPFTRTGLKNITLVSPAQLTDLADEVRRRFLNFLRPRGVSFEEDDSINQLMDQFEEYGERKSPYMIKEREKLEARCRKCNLDDTGANKDLIKRIIMYDITSLGLELGWEQAQVDAAVAALAKMPVGKLTAKQKAEQAAAKEKKAKAKQLKKAKDAIAHKFLISPSLTIGIEDWQQTFNQTNVSGARFACMWRAIAQAWLGDEKLWKRVHDRTMVLWNAVMNAQTVTTNPALQTRQQLYTQFDGVDGWVEDMTNAQWGDTDTAQVVADALDIQIFMYSPDFTDSPGGTTPEATWTVQVRGRDHTRARQVHIVNYPASVHWTALAGVGDGGIITAPPVQPIGTAAGVYGLGTLQQVSQLPVGHADNTDLRDSTNLDGHVADTREDEEHDDDDEKEQTDEDDDEESTSGAVATLLKAASSSESESESEAEVTIKGKKSGRGGKGGGRGGRGGGTAGGAAGTKSGTGGTGATEGGPTFKSKGGDSAMGTPKTPSAPTPSPLTKAKANAKVGRSKLAKSTLSSPLLPNRPVPGPNRPRTYPQGVVKAFNGNRSRPNYPRPSPNQPRRRGLTETSTAKPQGVIKTARRPVKAARTKGAPWKAVVI